MRCDLRNSPISPPQWEAPRGSNKSCQRYLHASLRIICLRFPCNTPPSHPPPASPGLSVQSGKVRSTGSFQDHHPVSIPLRRLAWGKNRDQSCGPPSRPSGLFRQTPASPHPGTICFFPESRKASARARPLREGGPGEGRGEGDSNPWSPPGSRAPLFIYFARSGPPLPPAFRSAPHSRAGPAGPSQPRGAGLAPGSPVAAPLPPGGIGRSDPARTAVSGHDDGPSPEVRRPNWGL